jgi:hypothetical protein
MSNIAIKGAATGTGVFTLESPATNTDRTLVLPDEAGTVLTSASDLTGVTGVPNPLTLGTVVASTSGTAIDFTDIPSWVKRITVMFDRVSTNGGAIILIQLGDSGGIETNDYIGFSGFDQGGGAGAYLSSYGGFNFYGTGGASNTNTGTLVLTQISTNRWVVNGRFAGESTFVTADITGVKELSDTLTQVRITTSGSDTFDFGSINIMYE